MRETFNAQKEIEGLAIMTNNGFNAMFDLHKEQAVKAGILTKDVDLLKHAVVELKRDMIAVKADLKSINKKLDIILSSMVTRYEFENHVLNHS